MAYITRTRTSVVVQMLLGFSLILGQCTPLRLGSADAAAVTSQLSRDLTSEQQELVEWAYSRYQSVDIEITGVPITFPDSASDCYGFGGVYMRTTHSIRICELNKSTIIHELAHAWLESTFDESDRREFMTHRGLDSWDDSTLEWAERGAEQAAEVITWALMDRNIQIRWVETTESGTTETYRLFKIPDSSADELMAAYQLLTGHMPTDRIDDDPSVVEDIPVSSPEARP